MDRAQYRISSLRTFFHRLVGNLPPSWREWLAERLLRRAGSPGPAAEHVFQYLLSTCKANGSKHNRRHAAVAEGADHFYERQYRQFLNATMGVFVMTATQALVAAGGLPEGRWWKRHRKTHATLLDAVDSAPPIFVIDRQSVAIAVLLPRLKREGEEAARVRWLCGGDLPAYYQTIVAGQRISCDDIRAEAIEQSHDGATLQLLDAVVKTRRLSVLALHPYDDDAMGLHITLYGVDCVDADQLANDHGLKPEALKPYRDAAKRLDRLLLFCVGGTEEVFTQCSQNLFIKRPVLASNAGTAPSANRLPPLEPFLAEQFEAIQVTVSATGLPGASPRNGNIGKAAFFARRRKRAYVLIPYHPGNAVHGHAAKLWTNPWGSLVVSDDHRTQVRLTVSGPCKVVTHAWVARVFPRVAQQVMAQLGHNDKPIAEPEYWFLQTVSKVVRQREPIGLNTLDPARPTCSISAGGKAHHSKKPAYFAANTLPVYDTALQHRREAAGRPRDPSGEQQRQWRESVREALAAREQHLRRCQEASADGSDQSVN